MPEKEIHRAAIASSACDIFLSIGTSAVVYPAAALPAEALRHGAIVFEINPHPTPLAAQAHFTLTFVAGMLLPELIAQVHSNRLRCDSASISASIDGV